MKFIAIVLFVAENLQTSAKLYEETFISVEAKSTEEAQKLAENYAKSCETTYKNGFNEEISVKFLQIIDVNQYLRENYENSVKELYSRHFEDLESYKKFEILSKK